MTTKICSKCGETKETAEFHRSSSTKDGLQNQCRVCKAAYAKTDKRKAYQAAYHATYDQTDRGRFANSKSSAKQRGIDFLFTFEEYVALITESERCYYCGRTEVESNNLSEFVKNYDGNDVKVLKLKINMGGHAHQSKHFTIDRLDSFGPYSDENCVCACTLCNEIKGWAFSARLFRKAAKDLVADLTEVCTAAGFNYTEEADHGN